VYGGGLAAPSNPLRIERQSGGIQRGLNPLLTERPSRGFEGGCKPSSLVFEKRGLTVSLFYASFPSISANPNLSSPSMSTFDDLIDKSTTKHRRTDGDDVSDEERHSSTKKKKSKSHRATRAEPDVDPSSYLIPIDEFKERAEEAPSLSLLQTIEMKTSTFESPVYKNGAEAYSQQPLVHALLVHFHMECSRVFRKTIEHHGLNIPVHPDANQDIPREEKAMTLEQLHNYCSFSDDFVLFLIDCEVYIACKNLNRIVMEVGKFEAKLILKQFPAPLKALCNQWFALLRTARLTR
jgi:hypothetical protein